MALPTWLRPRKDSRLRPAGAWPALRRAPAQAHAAGRTWAVCRMWWMRCARRWRCPRALRASAHGACPGRTGVWSVTRGPQECGADFAASLVIMVVMIKNRMQVLPLSEACHCLAFTNPLFKSYLSSQSYVMVNSLRELLARRNMLTVSHPDWSLGASERHYGCARACCCTGRLAVARRMRWRLHWPPLACAMLTLRALSS